jgi:hypothetical protein
MEQLYVTVPYYSYADQKSNWFSTVAMHLIRYEASRSHELPPDTFNLSYSVVIHSSSNCMGRAPYIHHDFSLSVNRL